MRRQKNKILAIGLVGTALSVGALFLSWLIDDQYKNKESAAKLPDVSYQEEGPEPEAVRIKYKLIAKNRLADFPEDGGVIKSIPSKEEAEIKAEDFSELVSKDIKEPLTIFVGDSRTVGLKSAANDTSIYIAKVGEGYNWYKESAEKLLVDTLNENADKNITVIFNLGVNDLDNAGKYAGAVNRLSSEYPSVTFKYLSVNPVEETTVTNIDIEKFNSTLQVMLDRNIGYIDSYTYLLADGFSTSDGLHYTDSTYKKIYDFTRSEIGG